MALEDFLEDFWTLEAESVSDGMGGLTKAYRDRESFRAAIAAASGTEMEIAGSVGTKTVFRITLPAGFALRQGDVIRRVRDGRRYRITSNSADRRTPDTAQVQYACADAEVIQ